MSDSNNKSGKDEILPPHSPKKISFYYISVLIPIFALLLIRDVSSIILPNIENDSIKGLTVVGVGLILLPLFFWWYRVYKRESKEVLGGLTESELVRLKRMKLYRNIFVFVVLIVTSLLIVGIFAFPKAKPNMKQPANMPTSTEQINDGVYKNGELHISKWGVKGNWPVEYKDVVVKVSEQANIAAFYSISVQENVVLTNCSWCEKEKDIEITLFSLEREYKGIKDASGQPLPEQDVVEGLKNGLFVKTGNSYYREGSSVLSGAQPSETVEEKKAIAILEKFAKSGSEFKKSLQIIK